MSFDDFDDDIEIDVSTDDTSAGPSAATAPFIASSSSSAAAKPSGGSSSPSRSSTATIGSKQHSHRQSSTGDEKKSAQRPSLQRSSSTSGVATTSSARPVRLSTSLAAAAADAMRQKAQREELKKLNDQRKNKKTVKHLPPSDAIVKLAAPATHKSDAISASFEDITHCFFKPRVSKFAQEIQVQPWNDRVIASIKDSNSRRKAALKGPPPPDPKVFPFKPDISHPTDEKVADTPKGDLVKRMEADSKQRIASAREKATKKLFSFRPTLTAGSQRHNAAITAPFMTRLQNDITQREEKKKAQRELASEEAERQRRDGDSGRWAQSAAVNTNTNHEREFMTRMTNDLNTRRRKQIYRDQLFAGVAPSLAASQSQRSLIIRRHSHADITNIGNSSASIASASNINGNGLVI